MQLWMKICLIIVATGRWLTHLQQFGLHVWDCVLDGAIQNSNTPSKTQSCTCIPNGWIRQNTCHRNTVNQIKKKNKKRKEKKKKKAGREIKTSTITLVCVKTCFSKAPWVIYLLLNLCSQAMFDFAWCWYRHCNRILWKGLPATVWSW